MGLENEGVLRVKTLLPSLGVDLLACAVFLHHLLALSRRISALFS